ncbi:GFA family protein [Lysobacter sp. CA199]|uniref:GFA family protein n=1 Tax=Lysobacter sp. CA199 TaxID=3455608 RepID=UPI003F8D8DB7
MLQAICHCGAVTIQLPRRPRVLTQCNCSMCVRVQPLFAYYTARTIAVHSSRGALESYVWGRRVLRWFRCKTCGCFTHHRPAGREYDAGARSGVNLRLVDPAQLRGVKVQLRDGATGTWKLIDSYRN